VASLFEEIRHRYVARAEDMYDAVARDDQESWENLAQGSATAGADLDFQRLRAAWSEAAHLGSQVSRSGVCEAIAEAARETVFCISCGGHGCGLCKPHCDFLNWSKRQLVEGGTGDEVQAREEPERTTTPQPLSAFQHFPLRRAEYANNTSGLRGARRARFPDGRGSIAEQES